MVLPGLLAVCTSRAGDGLRLKHGTVVVIFVSSERVVLAADSRVTFSGGRRGFEDTECKVADLGQETIFAELGVSRYDFGPQQKTTPFNAQTTARRVARSLPGETTDRAKAMAASWSKQVKNALDVELERHPQEVMASLRGSSKLLAGGVFAGKTSDGLVVYFAAVNCECSGEHKSASIKITQILPTDDGLPAAVIGTSEAMNLFSEMVEGRTARGLKELTSLSSEVNGDDRGAEVTVKTAEFVLRNSKDRMVGGPVNAIELSKSAQARWVRKEKNCR